MPQKSTHFDPLNATSLTRRDLARLMSAGVAALMLPSRAGAMIREGGRETATPPAAPVAFRLSSNENNYGLAPAAIAALKLKQVIGYACRYGGESMADLTAALSKAHGVPGPAHHAGGRLGRDSTRRHPGLHGAGQGARLRGADVRVAGPHCPGR